MVTQITLGTYGTQNGRSVLTGGASQLDTKSIIDAMVKAKRLPAVALETADTAIDAKTKAYGELKTLLTKLQTAADTLRNPPGVDNAAKNIFEYRTSSVSSSTGATASNYIEATVAPGAEIGSYSITNISDLAYQTKQQTGNISLADSTTASAVTANGSPTTGLFQAGTVNLRAVDGTAGGIPITLAQGDSLQTVASKFNEVSSRTGIQATVLNVSSGTYKLVFSATKTGTTYGFDLELTSPTSGAGVASDSAGVLSQIAFSTTQPAQNASFTIDGVTVSRESNAVSDVIDGVTFNLKQPSAAAGTLLVNVTPDTSIVSNAITQFADAYNAFKLFASNQSQLDDTGKPKDTSVLYNQSTFRTILDGVSSEVTRLVAGVGSGNPTMLADIGIAIDNFTGDDTNPATKNILTVDTDKLTSSLLSNYDGVRKLFEYSQTSDNVNFSTFKRANNLNMTSFSLAIDTTAGTYKATYTDTVGLTQTVDLDGTSLTGGGLTLTGKAGTAFEGSQFVYAGSGTVTVNVNLSQGYADRLYNLMDNFINSTDGLVTQEVNTLSDTKERHQTEITAIDDRLTAYRDKLLQQYAALEAALTSANQLLQMLDANANARNNA